MLNCRWGWGWGNCRATSHLGRALTLYSTLGRGGAFAVASVIQMQGQTQVCRILLNRVHNFSINEFFLIADTRTKQEGTMAEPSSASWAWRDLGSRFVGQTPHEDSGEYPENCISKQE